MSVRVVARIRPLLKQEIQRDTIVTAHQADSNDSNSRATIVRIPNPKNPAESFSYHFNSVYDQEVTQQDFFETEVAPTVKHLYNGFDVTIFAYGVTGTGKTHTMRGGKALADRGVIPRLLSAVYRRGRKIEKDTNGEKRVEVSMSYYEIYCDKVFDLFEPPERRTPSGLPIRDSNGKTVVVGLTERPCATLKEFEHLYDQANVNRSTSATKLNAHSSRSHAVLTVKISQISEDKTIISTASAIDLAGSEDNRRTENDKERLVESSSINKSLFVLAQCVDALQKKQARIPYRESKMTRILSLGNQNGITVMILNLAPIRSYHLDTVQSLGFASRAKKIEVREVENEPIFKGPAKPVAATGSGPNVRREPLKPITNGANLSLKSAMEAGKTVKPVKSFPVYRTSGSWESLKRPSILPPTTSSRPAKTVRTNDLTRPREAQVTRASVEELVERMIEEKLASRALQEPEKTNVLSISDEVQRRLDALESRIETKEGGRAEGLQYLLMGKQHQARGEDVSALRMYQLALPFFPDNEKLGQKMLTLQEKLRQKRVSMEVEKPAHTKPSLFDGDAGDEDYADAYGAQDDKFSDEDDFRPKAKARKTTKNVRVFMDNDGPTTPRSQHLLEVINTRDVAQIKGLRGVGVKKAELIVSALCDLSEGKVSDLEQLGNLKGVGVKSVMNMRDGLFV